MNIITIISVIVVLLNYANAAQYPDCITCPDGSIPLSPLSYNTVRSNVFNGTQPSNQGCTNGAIVSRRVTINCGQGTTLIDCDRGYSDSANYSDLSDYFIWSRTGSISQQVFITFRFYQQIKISRIGLLFWNSPSNSITIPNVRIYWGNYFDGSIVLTNPITNITTTNLLNITITGMHILNIDNNRPGLQYQYLRIEMSFYSEWIFLSEVQFCGNTAPFHITQPSTDNDVQIVSPTATMASVICSLNITIPDLMIITWEHNSQVSIVGFHGNAIRTSHGTTLLIRNPLSFDAGVYQCTFNNAPSGGWILKRNINLLITNPSIIYPSNDSQVVTFNDCMSSSQLMCSLNVPIPSSMTVTWLHNGTVAMTPPNEVITTGSTTTLVIRNLQPSDAGVYQCVFNDTVNGWMLRRNISVVVPTAANIISTISISTSASTTSSTTSITIITNIPTAITKTAPTSTAASNVGTTSITEAKVTTATNTITSNPVTTITTSAPNTYNTTSYSTTAITNTVTTAIKTAVTDATVTTTPMITDTDTYTNIDTLSTLLPTPHSALYDNNNSSNVGVIVAIVVLVVVVIIIITVVVVGIIVVQKERKSKHDSTTAESVYYSTINETKLQRGFKNKPEAFHDNEVHDKQLGKKNTQYMEIVIRADCSIADKHKVVMQNNPSYSLPSKHQVKMQDNPSYATSSGTKK